MKKVLRWAIIGIAGLIVVLIFARNFIARESVVVGVKRVTGFSIEIGAVNVGLFNGQLDVHDLKLMNPADFEERMFVDLPGFHVDYRLGSMLTGRPHITEMNVDLKEVIIVKNAKGESNIQRLKGVTAGSRDSKSSSSSSNFRLDVVHIHVGTVIFKDFSAGKHTERTMPVNITATYRDIRSSADISRLALMTVMSKVRLPDVGVNVDDLQKNLSGAPNVAGEAVKGLLDKLKPKQ